MRSSRPVESSASKFRFQLLVADIRLPDLAILHGYYSRAPAFLEVERQSVGDAAEPGGERGLAGIVAADMAESAEEGVLRQFLGVHHVVHLTDNHGEDTLPVAANHQALPLTSAAFHGFCYLFICIHSWQMFFGFFY